MNSLIPSKLMLTLLVASVMTCLPVAAVAQGMPGGMGGGMPSGGMRPPPAAKLPTVEDFIAPDPLLAWHARLQSLGEQLSLNASQRVAFDEFLRELDQMVKLNERQVWRVIGRSKAIASAVPDALRDLTAAKEDARDYAMAWDDVSNRYARLISLLGSDQQLLIQQAYGDSLASSTLQKRPPQMPTR
jgi:hypothetical protein